MNTSAWIEALGWTLIHFVWQGALVAACLWIAFQAAQKARPQLRYLAACLALLAAVAFAVVTFAREIKTTRSHQSSPGSPVAESPASHFAVTVSGDQPNVPSAAPTQFARAQPLDAKPSASFLAASPAKLRDRFAQALQPFTSTIVAVWILGVSLFSGRLWRSWRAVRHLRNSGERCEIPALQKRFIALRGALGASRAAHFLVSARVRVPMVIGWLKPVILLPASVLAGLSTAQLEAVLAHELAHIRRQDYLVNLLQNAIETVFFYHPAVWWISRRIREEREHCCDDIAAAATGGALEYVDALAALEESRASAPDLVLAINGGSLLGRARRLLLQKPAEGPAHGLFAGGLVLLLMAAIFVIPFTLSRAADPVASGETNAKPPQLPDASGASEHFRAFDEVKRRSLWPTELLQHLPFGPAHPIGLRVAWIFRPMRQDYALGEALACRIIIHNTGKDPVEFLTDPWRQDARWTVVEGKGNAVTPRIQPFRRWKDSEQRMRLAPGEAVELPSPGLGIGPGDFDEVYGDDRVGVYLPARAGDEYHCKWALTLKSAWAQSDDPALATPAPVNIETGEVKFRIYARDPAAPKPVSIAISDGRYILEPGLDMRINRVPMQFTGTVNGVNVPSDGKVLEKNWVSIDPRPAVIPPGGKITRKVSGFRLPDGDGTYVIAWQRGERTLWIGEADTVRKVDLTVAGKFPLKEVLDTVDPLERDRLRELAEQFSSGISFPEKQWAWENAAGFEGTPPEIKAALEQHRPKAVKEAAENTRLELGSTGAAKIVTGAGTLSVATPTADAAAQPSANKAESKPPHPDLVKQRQRVEKTRNEVAAIAEVKPEELPEVLRILGIADETMRKTHDSLRSALAEEAKLLATGLGDSHPRVKAARAEIEFYRKLIADQLESIKRAHRTKLQIEETQLKTMETHFQAPAKREPVKGVPAKEPEARHEQTRDLLKLWRAEFERKPLFAIAINQKLQRKDDPSKRAVPSASDDQPGRDVTFLDKRLSLEPRSQPTKSLPATLPAEAMRRVAMQVRKFIEASPGPAAEKFQSLLPRLEAEREWPWAEAVAMLDELCDIATGPVGWLGLEEQFRAFNRAKKGQAWDADALKALPFGPPNEQGLRAAWIFDPMQPAYAVSDVLKSRILFHNTGTQSIEFRTDAWHQEDQWNVIDASGKPVNVKTTRYTGITPLQRFRLDPGQVVEVAGHGAGIGAADYSEKYSVGAIGAEIPAQPGDELRCTWDVKLKPGSDSDPNAAELKPLRTGEVKFRVVPADPNAPKPPGLATAPGRYDLAPSMKLQVSQVASGKDGEPTKRVNTATILWFDANNVQTQSHQIELPPGLASYAIVWARGTTNLWIGKHDAVQKVDFSEAANVRIQAWPWDQGGDFGGIPENLRATLEKRRPKASAAAPSTPAATAAAESPKPSWKAAGRVTDKDGNPMPDVEIWVHTGQGSLHRTGLGKTNADGRYEVEFGLAVMMEKESPQLQFANVTAHKAGWFEKNLNRHGAGAAATREVSVDDLKGYGARADQLAVPGKTREVNFIMDRAVTIKGRLLGTGSFPRLPPQDYRGKDEKLIAGYIRYDRAPLTRWKVWLTGPELAPATGVFASAETDQEGRFEFKDVPVGFDWQIEVDTHRRGPAARTPLFKPRSADESAPDLEYIIEENAVKFLAPARKGAGPVAPQNNQGNIQFIEGESGRPIPNAAISVAFLTADPVTPPPTQMTADANGVAHIEASRNRMAILEPNVPDRWSSNGIVLGEGAQNGGALTPPSRPGGPMQIALWKGTKVTGRLLLPDGSPLRGAPLSVEAYVANEEWKKRLVPDRSTSVNWSKLTKTREDGTFVITVPPAEARNSLRVFSPEIAFGVTAPPETKAALAKCAPFHAADGGPDGKSTERQGVLDFGERKLLSGVFVRGRVEDSGGKPMPGIGVSLLYNPRSGISRATRTGADGRFAFPPMPPGEVTIHADPRLLLEGPLPHPPAEAVFVRQALTLREGTASVEIVARAVPVIALEFEWIDRRTKKGGPMSAFGTFPVSGSVRDSKGEMQPWNGSLEKTNRDGKVFLLAKMPAQIVDPVIQLPADAWVTARYEDDSTSSGPGICAIPDHATAKRRIIYGDDPQPGR